MSNEATMGRIEHVADVKQPFHQDNLSSYRSAEQPITTKSACTTSDAHLPSVQLTDSSNSDHFNPYHLPGKDEKDNVEFAKKHFTPIQLKQLEIEGPKYFNYTIDTIQKAPVNGKPMNQGELLEGIKDGLNTMQKSFLKNHGPTDRC